MTRIPYTPPGARYNGTSQIIKGKHLLHYTDISTGSDFTVPADRATPEEIERVQREHRANFRAAGSAFAPPSL